MAENEQPAPAEITTEEIIKRLEGVFKLALLKVIEETKGDAEARVKGLFEFKNIVINRLKDGANN